MEELKSKMIDLINKTNQKWVAALKEAYKNNTRVSSTEMFGSHSEITKEAEQYFREARERGKKKGKNFWR